MNFQASRGCFEVAVATDDDAVDANYKKRKNTIKIWSFYEGRGAFFD